MINLKSLINKFKLFSSIAFLILTLFLFGCSSDSDSTSSPNSSKTKLLAIDGVGSDLKIVELNNSDIQLIDVFYKFAVMQASVDFDFTYLKRTNELFIRRNVFENNLGSQIIKLNIDTFQESILSTESNSKIIVARDRLFGFDRRLNNSKLTIKLIEINNSDGSTMSTLETFNTLENAPQNDRTGIDKLFYSYDTNEIIIPRRLEFIQGAIDQLIKININTTERLNVPISHYETLTVGRNGRIFVIKRKTTSTAELTRQVVELDNSTGEEISILTEFEPPTFQSLELLYLSETNELLIDMGLTHKKVNIDTKEIIDLDNTGLFYSFRSINIY